MRVAFKEWDTVCEALGAGVQAVILRKGGIHEPGGRFRPEHAAFWLMPTRYHEAPDRLKPPWNRPAGASDPGAARVDVVPIRHVAHVVDAHELHAWEPLAALGPFHVYVESLVRERYERWQDQGLHVLVVRVAGLPQPAELPMRPAYGGCRSWVELEQAIDPTGARPVLTDSDFNRLRADIRARLEIAT